MPVLDVPDLALGNLPTPPPLSPHGPGAPEPAYHHVSKIKFIIYSICSLGLYDLWWCYKNWCFIRDRDGSNIRPFWRAVFHLIWCYPLTNDIARSHGRASALMVGLVAVFYIGLYVTWRLPDPYWLFSMATFVPLLYPVILIDQINRQRGVRGPYYARVRIHHVLFCGLGALLLALVLLVTFVNLPSAEVVKGDAIAKRDAAWLRASGVVKPDEVIEFFYSGGIWSIKGQGSLVTNQRVVAYETEADSDKLVVETAFYKDIKDIKVEYSESALEDTEVFISTGEDEDDGFYLTFSAEGKGDRSCVERLMELWKAARNSTADP